MDKWPLSADYSPPYQNLRGGTVMSYLLLGPIDNRVDAIASPTETEASSWKRREFLLRRRSRVKMVASEERGGLCNIAKDSVIPAPWHCRVLRTPKNSRPPCLIFRTCCFWFVLCMSIIDRSPTRAFSSDVQTGIWRVPGNDAINSLYMFIRVRGFSKSYETFLSQVQRTRENPTMRSLRDTSSDLGYPAEVVKASFDELLEPTFPTPAVLFFDRSGSEFGKWHLLLHANKQQVAILTGDTMVIDIIDVDRFRTDWSGYALVSRARASAMSIALRCSSLGLAFVAAISLAVRRVAIWHRSVHHS